MPFDKTFKSTNNCILRVSVLIYRLHKMNAFMVCALVICCVGFSNGRPQFSDSFQQQGRGNSDLSVNCQSQEVSPGVFKFNCAGVNPRSITLSSEHILWLKGTDGSTQQLDITVPNYRVEELIRAAIKQGIQGGSTAVNILLKKPETVYDVQAQEGANVPQSPPVVNLEYEGVPAPVSLHYPTDKAYNPISGPIREP